jgi:hypothetical protein
VKWDIKRGSKSTIEFAVAFDTIFKLHKHYFVAGKLILDFRYLKWVRRMGGEEGKYTGGRIGDTGGMKLNA